MALIFNGVTIPEDEAEALNFNGTDIKEVLFNGTSVWLQNLFRGIWSGSSIASGTDGSSAYKQGVSTSGANSRIVYPSYIGALGRAGELYGGWITANSSGLGNGTSQITMTTPAGAVQKMILTPALLDYVGNTLISFHTIPKFTSATGDLGEVSGGNMRMVSVNYGRPTTYGAWVTLT